MSNFAHYPSLKSKVVYITGGATGIGSVLVEQFIKQSAKVYFIDIDNQSGHQLCEKLHKDYNNAPKFTQLDATNITRLQQHINEVAQVEGQIDVLINNVADDTRHSPLDVDQQFWRNCLSVNLDAAFFACQAVIPTMRTVRKGNIINISSINVLIGPKQMPGYVAAKSALNGLSKSLANQYGEYGIRVNTVLPGWVATQKQLNSHLTPEANKEWQRSVALRGDLTPSHVANVVLFLAADDSDMITGQQFVIDAGRT